MVNLGYRIKQLRTTKRLTQNQLANRLGLTKSAISAYENSERVPSYDILIKLASLFNVTTDYLLGRKVEKTIDVSKLSDNDYILICDLVNSLEQK